jgi:hypothetical protein
MKEGNGKTKDKKQIHGAYANVTRYRERGLDLRRREDKALKAFQDSIISDMGGLQEMDVYQVSMMDRATECLIILRCMAEHVEGEGIMEKDGQLAPCLRHSYVSYLNSFRLTMEAIYARNGKKASSKIPSIHDLMKGDTQ